MMRSLPVLALFLAGCATWSPAPLPTPADTGYRTAGELRITDTTGRAHSAPRGAFTRGDHLFFATPEQTADSLPLTAIRAVEEHKVHEWRTIGLAVVIMVPLGVLIGLMASGYAN